VANLVADGSIDNETAVEEIARAIFNIKEAEANDLDGQVHATLAVYGMDTSRMSAGADMGRNRTGKRIDVGMISFSCTSFLKAARKRGLSELDLTLNTAALDGSGRRVWIPVYRFVLEEENFDKFFQIAKSTFSERDIRNLERIVDVKLDAFSLLKYKED
jgi:hypothetical protein